MNDPYRQPPVTPPPVGGPQPLGYQTPGVSGVVCPKCRHPQARPVSFTWWGGVVGPKLLSHVKCVGCGTAYNGKTGQPNTTAIVIYSLVAFALVAVLYFLVVF